MKDRKEQKRQYYLKNREKTLLRMKRNYDSKKLDESFKAYRREISKKYYEANKEKCVKKTSKYNKNNRLKINNRIKKYKTTNFNFKLASNLRSRLYSVLKRGYKTSSVLKLIGCSLDELKIHLESKFVEGMSWENYTRDGWHVDHVKPCALFDLTDPEQQKECFNYTNLQPLWAKDNHSKSYKYIY